MKNKFYIFRKGFVWSCIGIIIFVSLFIITLLATVFKQTKTSDGLLAILISSTLLLFMLWMTSRTYIQYIEISDSYISVGSFLGKVKSLKWDEIEKVYICEFSKIPKYIRGSRLRGIGSNTAMPKYIPNKWIVFDDGKCQKNLANIYSYLVPIRKHMIIKIKYSENLFETILKVYKGDIEEKLIPEHKYDD